MQAWRIHELGEPAQVLRLDDVDTPQVSDRQVLVRVRAATVNFPDVLMCRGQYQVRPPLPFTPGIELCGEVAEVGPSVSGLAVGDRVIGSPALPNGAFAGYAVLDEQVCYPAPPSLDDAEASALFIAYQTGWFGLHRRAGLRSGETLLVHAAAGGVGSAAVQLGKAAGARVIGVVGGDEKAKVARDLGADVVVDRTREDVVAVVKDLTSGRGVDVVYDSVGGDAYAQSVRCVGFEGRVLVIGFASGTIPTPALGHALVKNYSIVGLHWGLYQQRDPAAVRAVQAQIKVLVEKGEVRPLVSERVGLDGVPDAVERLAAGRTTGRVAVLP